MKTNINLPVLSALVAAALCVACGGGSGSNGESAAALSSGQRTASVRGTISYHERLPFTPEATLIVELRDTSLADAPSRLIGSQTIAGPGQVPIEFDVAYDPGDIDPGSRYSLSARIVEADGRLAFTNDTAYDVLTHGNPHRVYMLLILVEPPPNLVGDNTDWRTWREVPAQVIWANLIPNEPVHLLRIAYFQSTLENCARPGSQNLTLDGRNIIVRLTLSQPPDTPWSPPCQEEEVELDTVLHVGESLSPGPPYTVIVNDAETTKFTLPEAHLGHTAIAQSPVQSADVVISETPPYQHTLRIVSELPKGSGCSQVNGYEIRRSSSHQFDVAITHHEVADPFVVCTADFPIVETDVPLGASLQPGAEYTVNVNSDTSVTFVAR